MDTLFSFTYMRVLVAALIVTIIAAVAMQAAQSFDWLVNEDNYATINVTGYAEVMAIPDVGSFSFTVETEAADVATAQTESTETMNAIMAYLKEEAGVEEKDISTTGYNAYPRYEYQTVGNCAFGDCTRERELAAYVVTQNVQVKVRNTEDAGSLIGGVGQRGATNMSGLNFEVDDLEAKREEARLAAIADAKEKAKQRAAELEVRLGDVVSFYEDGNDGYYPMPYESRAMMDMAEDSMMAMGGAAPEIAVGEDTITANVTITYRIK